MEADNTSRLQQLQREEMELERLLQSNLRETTAPYIQELLVLVRDEIAREQQKAKAASKAA